MSPQFIAFRTEVNGLPGESHGGRRGSQASHGAVGVQWGCRQWGRVVDSLGEGDLLCAIIWIKCDRRLRPLRRLRYAGSAGEVYFGGEGVVLGGEIFCEMASRGALSGILLETYFGS